MPLSQQERSRRSQALRAYAGNIDEETIDAVINDSADIPAEDFDQQFTQGDTQPTATRTFAPATRIPNKPTPAPGRVTGMGEYDKATTHPKRQDESENSITDFFTSMQQGGMRGRRQRISPEAYQQETRLLRSNADNFEKLLGQLNNEYERLDPPARAQFTELQKRSEGAHRGLTSGRLNELEYLRALDTVNQQAQRYKWEYHKIAPGGQLGDQIVVEGVIKTRTEKGLEPTGFTPDFIKQNTISVGRGKLAVPVAPGKPYQIIDEEKYDRDISQEQELFEKMDKAIGEQFDREVQVWQKSHTKKDLLSGEEKIEEIPSEVYEQLMQRASANTIARYRRAKHATKQILDGGNRPDSPEAIQADTTDPTDDLMNQRRKEAEERSTHDDQINNLIRRSGAPKTSSISPQDKILNDRLQTAKTPGEKIQMQVDDWTNDPVIYAKASMPVKVKTPDDVKKIKDGEVVQTPNGSKFLKKNNKLYQLK